MILGFGVLLLWHERACWLSPGMLRIARLPALAGGAAAALLLALKAAVATEAGWARSAGALTTMAAFVCHMMLAAAATACMAKGRCRRGSSPPVRCCDDMMPGRLRAALGAAGWFLLVAVLWRGTGHADGSVHLTMNAMPTTLAVCFASCGFVAMSGGAWRGVACGTPWIVLTMMTTSRLGVLLILVAVSVRWLAPMAAAIANGTSRRILAIIAASSVLVATTTALLWPLLPGSRVAAAASEALQGPVALELAVRAGRVLRIAPVLGEPAGWLLRGVSPAAADRLVAAVAIEDDRYELWRECLHGIAEAPAGTWPARMELRTSVSEGNLKPSVYRYGYPHNSLLECALAFGVLPGAILALGLLVVSAMAVRAALSTDVMAQLGGAAFLAEVIRAQFSGSLADNVSLVLLGAFILARQPCSSDAALRAP
jgi:hypothetical protein